MTLVQASSQHGPVLFPQMAITYPFKIFLDFAYAYFSFCLISCNMDILKNRIDIFSVETSFCQFSNMASSGLKKMFILQYYIHKNVYQKNVFQNNIFLFHNGRCYAIC